MKNQELRDRTKMFALRIVRMFVALPTSTEAQVLGKQVLRAGTSVAANYREASRARSDAELISKLGIVEQELDETLLWLELIVESKIFTDARMCQLQQEADELLAIVVTAIKTAKGRTKGGRRKGEGGGTKEAGDEQEDGDQESSDQIDERPT
jgi:four helix bundle protein